MAPRTLPALTILVALWGCARPGLPAVGSAAAPLSPGRAAPRFVPPYAYEWFVRAELARAQGDPGAAVRAYERVLAGDTDDAYVLARMAEAQLELDALDEAEATLALALRLDPYCERAWLLRGALSERRSLYEQALAAYHDAARVAPGSALAVSELARMLRARGHTMRSDALQRELARGSAGHGAGQAQRELELGLQRGDAEAIARSLRRLTREHGVRGEGLRRGVRALLDAGRAELAVPLVGAVDGEYDEAALTLEVWLAAGELERAERLLRAAPPDALGGPPAMTAAYLRMGQPERALESLALWPELAADHRRHRLAARAALERGDCDEAARQLAAIPASSQEQSAARTDLQHTLRCLGLPALADEL